MTEATAQHVRVQVWFGETVIDSYTTDADVAQQYAELTQRRYAGLRVTLEYDVSTGAVKALPERRLWPLTVK